MPIRKTDTLPWYSKFFIHHEYRKFAYWCVQDIEKPSGGTNIALKRFDEKPVSSKQVLDAFNNAISNGKTFNLILNDIIDKPETELALVNISDNNHVNIYNLNVTSNAIDNCPIILIGLNIILVGLEYEIPPEHIRFIDCKIGKVTLRNGASASFENTFIGTLDISAGTKPAGTLKFTGGCIQNIQCPDPTSPTPFKDDVVIKDIFIPKSTKHYLLKDAQQYRNLRHHLLMMENAQVANLFHSAELAVERDNNDLAYKIVSYLYEILSDFGSSISRPLLFLILGFCFSFYLLTITETAIPTSPSNTEYYTGWKAILLGDESVNNIARSAYLAAQPIFNPLGIIKIRTPVIPDTITITLLLGAQGIFSIICVTLFIFSIRRRFKIKT